MGKGVDYMTIFDVVTIVYTPPFLLGGGGGRGGLNLLPSFQKGGLGRTLIFRGGVTFLRGGCNFYIKYELKSEMFKACVHYFLKT